jgi:hypothetical protein
VGEHLLPALINGDESGLDSHDLHSLERDIEGWLSESDEQPLIFDVEDIDAGTFFARCHVTGLHNNCYKLKVYSIDQNKTDGDSSQD